MDNQVIIGTPPIVVHIRRSARARKYALRISNADGRVNLTVPARASLDQAVDFAKRQEVWLHKNLAKRAPLVIPSFGEIFVFEGQDLRIQPVTGRRVQRIGDILQVPDDPDKLAARLRGFCKVQARERLVAASEKYAHMLGVSFGRVTLRDTRTRWGSCTQSGDLMYSWRLILAPALVLDYVAAHEVAHLVELNHSAAYWDVVRQICPLYQRHRDWLRTKGSQLHQVQI